MNILAIDITSPHGSLAVRSNGALVAAKAIESPDGFAHILFPALAAVLAEAGIALNQIDCFAGASGPGAFTGVRVGLTAVKGLGEALQKPVAGVSNLRALSTFGTAPTRGVVLDARRGDVFAAVYAADFELIGEEIVGRLDAWLAMPGCPDEFILQQPALLQERNLRLIEAPLRLAPAVALCAELDAARGRWLDPAALDANYVRRSDAELFWKG